MPQERCQPTGSGLLSGLEVIGRGQGSDVHPVPLLFVHGAWHAAWCWDEHFLTYFAQLGYRALAVSLRGHGKSPSAKRLRACSLSDYVQDVTTIAESLTPPPVVVGHSMGGLIVLKYLESHHAPAGVLLAPTLPLGYLATGFRWARKHPWHFVQMAVTGRSLAHVSPPDLARQRFFCAHTPEDRVRDVAARLQEESGRIGFDGVLSLPRTRRVNSPLLVLGAVNDGSVTCRRVRATARAYRTRAEFFPHMGHDMMLEPGWAVVAGRIDSWLRGRGL